MRWIGVAVLIGATQAAAETMDCRPLQDLALSGAKPALFQVQPGPPIHFVADASTHRGCPNASAACRAHTQVASCESVVVTRVEGAFACAAHVGPPPKPAESEGWLPMSAIRPAPAAKPAPWTGTWRTGPDQRITLRKAAGGKLSIKGEASWGAEDPDRAARGAVNTGEIDAVARPVADKLVFPAGGAADDCAATLWRLGPYLVVADNDRCGGMNVTFTGLYRQVTRSGRR